MIRQPAPLRRMLLNVALTLLLVLQMFVKVEAQVFMSCYDCKNCNFIEGEPRQVMCEVNKRCAKVEINALVYSRIDRMCLDRCPSGVMRDMVHPFVNYHCCFGDLCIVTMTNDKTNILVAARVRPLLGKEGTEPALEVAVGEGYGGSIFVERGGTNKQFTFDYVFGPQSEQTDVYIAVKPLVESILDGYNATVFAYGQTGSGKTFTMGTDALSLSDAACQATDSSSRRGVVSRATEHLFSMMSERRSQALADGKPVPEFSVSVVFVEIYCDDVVDLLSGKKEAPAPDGGKSNANNNIPGMKRATTVVKSKPPPKKANVRSNEHGDIVLDGVTSIACDSSTSVLSCLQEGSLARRTATTAYNERSSRSHAIFTIIVNQHRFIKPAKSTASENCAAEPEAENAFDDLTDEVLVAKMHFVDLAGSERLHDAVISTGHAALERFREGVNINMGLLTLGKVISLLSEGKTMQQYIPYRESKLTRLLQDSLGGNSRTLMIACVSAADCYVEQSVNTLQYATNARKIKNQAVVNRASSVAQLRAEIQMLRRRLEARTGGVDPEATAEIAKLRLENDDLRLRNNALTELMQKQERRTADLSSTRCEKSIQTDMSVNDMKPPALIAQASKAVLPSKSPEIEDSTLTDSKLGSSFKQMLQNVVAQQAEVLALKEQMSGPASGVFSPGPSGRLLSIAPELGLMREARERRRKRNAESTIDSSIRTSTSNSIVSSCSDKEATPQSNNPHASHKESGQLCASCIECIFTASSAVSNGDDYDDEYRDPTYEPTPLRHPTGRTRRHFECIEDSLGNRRLTRAAVGTKERHPMDSDDTFSAKKSRLGGGDSNDVSSSREFCQCHGSCKLSSRCACKRNGNPCGHSENSAGCQCNPVMCSNKVGGRNNENSLGSVNEEVSAGGEKSKRESGGHGRRR